jgi:hypothetical protein
MAAGEADVACGGGQRGQCYVARKVAATDRLGGWELRQKRRGEEGFVGRRRTAAVDGGRRR